MGALHRLLLAALALGIAAAAAAAGGAPAVANGNFNAPFDGSWYFETLGAPITRVKRGGFYRMLVPNVNCENEEYAEMFGRIVGTAGGKSYTLSFNYLYTKETRHAIWGMSYFAATGCDPCDVYFFSNIRNTRHAKAGVWYKWQGDFKKPDSLGAKNLTFEVDLNTCNYRGDTLFDNFTVSPKK